MYAQALTSPLRVYHSLNIFFTVHYGHIDRSIRTQADWPVQGVMNADDVIGILHHHWVLCKRRLSRRATATPTCGYEHLLCIPHGASRNRYRVKLFTLDGMRLSSIEILNCMLSETASTL